MTKKKKKTNRALVVAVLAVIGFGAVFAYFVYDYYLYWRDGQIAQENTKIVRDIFQDQIADVRDFIATLPALMPDDGMTHTNGQLPFSTAALREARERVGNSDIVAYIYIPGTNVSNVVVQGRDNNFYLRRDMFGNHNVNGSLFLDYRNTLDFADPNTIIYGHNMRNGTMFHDLRFFLRDPHFAQDNRHIIVITDHQILFYEVASVFSTHISFDYIQVHFDSLEEFGELVAEIMRRNAVYTGVDMDAEDRMLVLSTCTEVSGDNRIVVVGRLAWTIEFDEQ
ncbi:MAG: class B sortase [Defluviitaleaceae bacterium]|nr:class B sortase [Defluviitaleaceae bacterium]